MTHKVGIYGGSFNPVHFGHVGLAKWVIENTDLDELWLMVSPNNPLKPANLLAPEGERLAAVSKAVKDIPHVKASDFEFSLPRPSYTANTLRELQKAYPDTAAVLIRHIPAGKSFPTPSCEEESEYGKLLLYSL